MKTLAYPARFSPNCVAGVAWGNPPPAAEFQFQPRNP